MLENMAPENQKGEPMGFSFHRYLKLSAFLGLLFIIKADFQAPSSLSAGSVVLRLSMV